MTRHSACYDVFSSIDISLPPQKSVIVKTGLSFIMDAKYEIIIRSRTSIFLKNIMTLVGTIDADFTEEMGVVMMNLGEHAYSIRVGDRIAQIQIHQLPNCILVDEEDSPLPINNVDRQGGFGSTGK